MSQFFSRPMTINPQFLCKSSAETALIVGEECVLLGSLSDSSANPKASVELSQRAGAFAGPGRMERRV